MKSLLKNIKDRNPRYGQDYFLLHFYLEIAKRYIDFTWKSTTRYSILACKEQSIFKERNAEWPEIEREKKKKESKTLGRSTGLSLRR